jgi:hypothetical protein
MIKDFMHSIGIEAFRYDPSATQFGRFATALKVFEIDCILDVGANEGQFGESLRASGYTGDIVSFEPLNSAHINLLKRSKPDPHWHVHSRCAVGDSLGEIDTQGYEWQVLDGALDVIHNARGVLIEMSLIPLYEGQKLWQDITNRLESEGFTLWALQPAFIDPANGRTLQLDGLFFRL